MIKVKEFYKYYGIGIDKQINTFLENNIFIEIIDIKYQVMYDSSHDDFRSSALLIYKEL